MLISKIKSSERHNPWLRMALTPQESTADGRAPEIDTRRGGVGKSGVTFFDFWCEDMVRQEELLNTSYHQQSDFLHLFFPSFRTHNPDRAIIGTKL